MVVLEARDRVGGRLWTDVIDGAMLEIGGQWVSPDQEALNETLAELGLETYSRYREGDSVYVGKAGELTRFTGEIFPVPPATEQAMVASSSRSSTRWWPRSTPTSRGSTPTPTSSTASRSRPGCAEQTDDQEARDNIALFIAGAMLTKPAYAFSALQALLMAASAGSFSHLVDADYILDKRVVGGLQQVPLLLAERLGDDVLLESAGAHPRVVATPASPSITDGDVTVRARFAILAHAPILYPWIDFVARAAATQAADAPAHLDGLRLPVSAATPSSTVTSAASVSMRRLRWSPRPATHWAPCACSTPSGNAQPRPARQPAGARRTGRRGARAAPADPVARPGTVGTDPEQRRAHRLRRPAEP